MAHICRSPVENKLQGQDRPQTYLALLPRQDAARELSPEWIIIKQQNGIYGEGESERLSVGSCNLLVLPIRS